MAVDPAAQPADPANPAADPAANPAPAADPAPAPAADPANPAADPAAPAADPANPADPATDPANPENAPAPIELKVPDGFALDEELGTQFKEFCASKNLSSEDAQTLFDLQVKVREKEAQAVREQQQQWIESAKSDKEFGGSKFDHNLAIANKALTAFGSPELITLMKSTGFGNHPEVIRAFVKIGNAVGEDKLVVRSTDTPAPVKNDPVSIYSNSNMNP